MKWQLDGSSPVRIAAAWALLLTIPIAIGFIVMLAFKSHLVSDDCRQMVADVEDAAHRVDAVLESSTTNYQVARSATLRLVSQIDETLQQCRDELSATVVKDLQEARIIATRGLADLDNIG